MRPTKDDLQKLYHVDGLTTRQIGAIYGVAHISVRRWLFKHGVDIKPGGCGLDRRGITPPTKEELTEMIHSKHLSYSQVAEKYGVDSTAVPYWLNKLGIPKPKVNVTRTKGRVLDIDNTEVRLMYDSGDSLKKIARHYGVSESVISRLCKSIGIEVKPPGFTGEEYISCDGTLVRSTYEIRVANWLFNRKIKYSYEPKYPSHKRFKADFSANGWLIEIWGVEGNDRYNQRKKEKIDFCNCRGIPLIQLNPWNFDKRNEHMLERILSQVLAEAHAQGMLF